MSRDLRLLAGDALSKIIGAGAFWAWWDLACIKAISPHVILYVLRAQVSVKYKIFYIISSRYYVF